MYVCVSFRQLYLGILALILIDYSAVFLIFPNKHDTVLYLNHFKSNLLQKAYHYNFSHILFVGVGVQYFTLISSHSPLQ